MFGLIGAGVAIVTGNPTEAEAAMPVAVQPLPPQATTAEVRPGRDTVPEAENAQVFIVRRRRRRVFVRRRRRVVVVRRRRRRFW
jgi:hypothetical protein